MRVFLLTFWRIFSTVCAFVVLTGLFVMVNLESILMVNNPLQKAEHAIVLDGNNARLLRAKELLDAGLVSDIWVSNGEPAHPDEIERIVEELGYHAPDRTEIKRQILEKIGVPSAKIVFFGHGSLTTRDEAKALHETLGDHPAKLILVTTNYHSRRAQAIFREALPQTDVQVTCQEGCVAPAHWWKDPAVTAQFVLEFVKHIYFRLGLAVTA
jgi:uncharacterized SAM-binding protein YcdF (DUF218 family)